MDVFILIYLASKIYKKAIRNGESPWFWVLRLIFLFVSSELLVGLVVLNYCGFENIVYAVIPALLLAVGSAYYVFQQLNRIIAQNENDYKEEEPQDNRPNLEHFR